MTGSATARLVLLSVEGLLAAGLIQSIDPDRADRTLFYARISDLMEFDRPVPYSREALFAFWPWLYRQRNLVERSSSQQALPRHRHRYGKCPENYLAAPKLVRTRIRWARAESAAA